MTILLIFILLLFFYIILQDGHKKQITIQLNTFSSNRVLTSDQLLPQVLYSSQFQFTKIENHKPWHFHITGKDDFFNGVINNLPIINQKQKIMGIPGKWTLGSKHKLWMALEKKLGRSQAAKIMPETFVLNRDLHYLIKDFNRINSKKNISNSHNDIYNKPIYFMKKDIQRQKGIVLTSNLDQIKNGRRQGYVVVQKYLTNPLLFKKHKVNLRVYLVIIQNSLGRNNCYMYHDGIISYSGLPYDINQLDNFDSTVASFYGSKSLYDQGYPITWKQLLNDNFDSNQGNAVWKKVKNLMRNVMKVCLPQMKPYRYKYHNTGFELFGADIFIDDNLIPWLIEINVGPGMTPYNSDDDIMRRQLYVDMFNLAVLEKSVDNFVKLM